ncbi:MAG: hypothetical protein K2M70_13980 [Lachnospiraceae bacterium]|nr:hypothetical protein [Lachnospiraceae bacterium]
MFAIRLIARNVSRHKYKSILHILIGVLTVLILDIYAGNMDSTGEQLAKLPEVLEVPAKISVLNGSLTEGMTIREDRMMGVRESEYVKDPVFTVRMKFGLGSFTVEEYKDNLNYYGMGINAVAGVPGMKREDITFLEGVDESVLETTQKVCILDADLMEKSGLRLGEDVMLTIFYYRYALEGSEIFIEPLTTDTYRIVGQVEIEDYRGGWVPPEAILPLDCVREAYHDQDIPFFADSGSFVVKDPFQLNALKEQMRYDVTFLPVITRAEYRYDGNALTIMDETFIRSAEALQGNLSLLRGMLPFIVAIVIFIGYLCSYLSLQSRQEEYALMRSLGTGRGKSFFLLFGETALVAAGACLLGSFTALIFFGTKAEVLALAGALFFLAFLAGTAAALLALYRLSVMEMLSKND